MKISQPIYQAEFLNRVNRFTAEVRVNGRRAKAHLPNPSKLLELFKPGTKVLVTLAPKNARKTTYSIFGVYTRDLLVGIDSRFPNQLFAEAVEAGRLAEFSGYHISRREASFGSVRFDFLLERPGDRALVEVKSCSLVVDGVALFPDVPTQKGLRHILKLADAVKTGYRAYLVWVVQRADAKYLRPYREVHPEIEEALRKAVNSGVTLLAYTAQLQDSEMWIVGRIPVRVRVATENQVDKAARFLSQSIGPDYMTARLYSSLLAKGWMTTEEIKTQSEGGVETLLRLGLAIVHPSDSNKLIPLHPRLAVTNLVKMLARSPPRPDVDRAVALLSGLNRESERAEG